MECVDGVCRFVPKSQRAAAAPTDENAPPVAALPPVKVGDVPPMPLPLEPLMEGEPEATTVQALTQEKGMVVVLGASSPPEPVCCWVLGLGMICSPVGGFPSHSHHPITTPTTTTTKPDLWSTACVRCPEALGKLDGVAAQYTEEAQAGKVLIATVNIDDREKGGGMVKERCVRWGCVRWGCVHGTDGRTATPDRGPAGRQA